MVKILIENTQEDNIKKQIKDVIKNVTNKIINSLDNKDDYFTNEVFKQLIGFDYVDKKGNLIDYDILDDEEKDIMNSKLSKKYSDKEIEFEINSIFKDIINDTII